MKMKMKNNLFSIAILMVIITFSAFNCERATPGGGDPVGPGGPGDGGPGGGGPVNPGGDDRIINISIAGNWEIESENMGQFLKITNALYGLSANNLNTSGIAFNQSYIDMENPKSISAYSNSDKYFVIAQGSTVFRLFVWETDTSADPDKLYICQLGGDYSTSALAEAGVASISLTSLNRSEAPDGGCGSATDGWDKYTMVVDPTGTGGNGDGDGGPGDGDGGDRIINISIAGNWEIESETSGQFFQITNNQYGLSANNLNTSGVGFNQSYIDMGNSKNISAYSNSDKYFVIANGSMDFLLFAWETNTSADPNELYICQLGGNYDTSALAEDGAESIFLNSLNRSTAPGGGCRSAAGAWTTYTVDDIAIAGNWEIEIEMGQFLQITNTQYGLSNMGIIDTLGMAFNQSYIDMGNTNNISAYSNSDKYFVIAQDPMDFRLFVWENKYIS